MIATANQLADPRTRAKQRLRAAARRKPVADTTPTSSSLANSAKTGVTAFVTKHPAATAATLLALSALFGPVRLFRLGLATVRTVSMATGIAKFVGKLPPTK